MITTQMILNVYAKLLQSQELVHFNNQHTATSYMTRADECKDDYHGCEHNQKIL